MTAREPRSTVLPLPLAQTPSRGGPRTALKVARRHPLGVVGAILILMLAVVGIGAPWIAPYPASQIGVGPPLAGPSWALPFGTDNLGRDMLSRVIFGARISLLVGTLSVFGGVSVGVLIGLVTGYLGGAVDTIIQRFFDIWQAFPGLIILLIIIRLLGPSLTNVILVLGISFVPGTSRIFRGAVLAERNAVYVEAARALGATSRRIMFLAIAPNILSLVIVIMSILLGVAVLAEAGLSFLGLGIPPPNPSWGSDINTARGFLPVHTWWAFFPGLAITLTVLGFNLLGDALRDILDPRQRSGRR